MKQLLRSGLNIFEGDPFVLTTIAFLIFLIIVFPAAKILSKFVSIEITRFIAVNWFLLLIIVTGVVTMVRKEYSMFAFVVTGKLAIIIGSSDLTL